MDVMFCRDACFYFVESRRLVSQRHMNPLNTLYGGYMLELVVNAETMAAMNFVEGK